MNTKVLITTRCPTCGSENIKKVTRDWNSKFKGQTYTVPSLEFYECYECGEKVYDRYAMKQIEAKSPAFVKSKTEVLT